MSEVSTDTPAPPEPQSTPSRRGLVGVLRSMELDPRLFGMIAALIVIWIGFNIIERLNNFCGASTC